MKRSLVGVACIQAGWFLVFSATLFANSSESHKFEFKEGPQNYFLVAILDPQNDKQLKGFRLFDSTNQPVQFIDHEGDLTNKVPEYITGAIPSGQPVQFADCNFDGYLDLMLREDISPRFESFEIWLWSPKQHKFTPATALNDLEINRIDPKKKYLYSGGSGGHGDFSTEAYTYSRSGKIVHVYSDIIHYSQNIEIKTFYSKGKVTKQVVSVPKPLE